MSIPKVKGITYELIHKELPKKVKFRIMSVAENRAVTQAVDMGDASSKTDIIMKIVESCTGGQIKPETIPSYLLEYVFMQIYTKSVQNRAPAFYTCDAQAMTDDEAGKRILAFEEDGTTPKICGTSTKVIMPIDQAEIIYPDNFDENQILKLDENISIHFQVMTFLGVQEIVDLEAELVILKNKYAELAFLEEGTVHTEDGAKNLRQIEAEFAAVDQEIQNKILFNSVKYISNGPDKLVPGVDFSVEELITWIDELDNTAESKIEDFFKVIPYLGHTFDVVCSSCLNKKQITLKGLDSFFL